MKNYNEIAKSVFERRDNYVAEKKARMKIVKHTVSAVGYCCLVALLGFGTWKSGILDQAPITLTGDDSGSAGIITSIGNTESRTNPSDNNFADTNIPPNQSSQTESQKDISPGPSGSDKLQGNTTSNPNGGNESQTTAPSDDPIAHAVYCTIPATYEKAKRLFGYPIIECSNSDFLGYEIGAVTPNGNIHDSNIRYLSVIYLFRNGKIELTDQNRLGAGAYISYDFYPSEEYKGYTFWHDCTSNNIYFPLSDTLLMTANFSNMELSEIYDLLFILGGKN